MTIKNFTPGELYKLIVFEDFYHFPNNRSNDEYNLEELAKGWCRLDQGTILTYIKCVVEIVSRNSNMIPQKIEIPVFYYNDRLVISYSGIPTAYQLFDEVIDDS